MSCRVAIDCDGVLADFDRAFLNEANRLYPGIVPTDYVHRQWDYSDIMTKEQEQAVFDAAMATENWWFRLYALPGISHLARWFVERKNEDVWIVTSRFTTTGLTTTMQTRMWLEACGLRPQHNSLNIITGCQPTGKVKIYKAMDIGWSLDDKSETVEQCDKLEGHKAYLLDQPWNQKAQVKRRVKSVEEFLKDVK